MQNNWIRKKECAYELKELLSILEYYKNKNIQIVALEIDNELEIKGNSVVE